MARNFYRIFTENNPVMGDSKTFGIPEAKGLATCTSRIHGSFFTTRATASLFIRLSLGNIDSFSFTIYRQTYIEIFDNIAIIFVFHA